MTTFRRCRRPSARGPNRDLGVHVGGGLPWRHFADLGLIMHMTRKQAARMRGVINKIDVGPASLQNSPDFLEAYRVWARHQIIPELQNMLPETERVSLPPITSKVDRTPH